MAAADDDEGEALFRINPVLDHGLGVVLIILSGWFLVWVFIDARPLHPHATLPPPHPNRRLGSREPA